MTRRRCVSFSLECILLIIFFYHSSGFNVISSKSNTVHYHRQQLTINAADINNDNLDRERIVAKRIIVTGKAVNGGYYRACVLNEAGRFRRLSGTMTPPDESSDEAEIYVEGKKKLVEGFVRWCYRGNKNVGLNQITTVKDVIDEEPIGLYDDFYVKTH